MKINPHKLEPALNSAIAHKRIEGEHRFHVLVDNLPTGEQLEKLLEAGFDVESTFDDVVTGTTKIDTLGKITTLDFIRLIALAHEPHESN